jgi:phage gp45-like
VGLLELATVERTEIANRNGGPGQTVYAKVKGLGGAVKNVEIYGQAGVFSRPGKGTRAVLVPLGVGGNYRIAIAFHNYQINIDWTDEGETTIFSTDTAGATVKARIDLKADGNIYLNGTSKYLVTWGALSQALTSLCGTLAGHVHPSNGAVSPGLVGLAADISGAKATTLRTDG